MIQLDFTAYYCAGAVLNAHGDPYLAAPMAACENHVLAGAGVLPAPLPPYTLALFRLLAVLPYSAAIALFIALIINATLVTASVLAMLTHFSKGALAFVFLAFGTRLWVLGAELFPLALGAAVGAALAAERGQHRRAALLGALAMIEPQIGLPVCLALFVRFAEARLTLVLCGLFALAACMVDWPLTVEYFTRVLPAHGASEVPWVTQYGLPHLLFSLGVSHALQIGTIASLVVLLLGVILTYKRRPAQAVLYPLAIATAGAAFSHEQLVAAALPGALLAADGSSGPRRTLLFAASLVLSISWLRLSFPFYFISSAICVYAFAQFLAGRTFRVAALLAAAVIALGLLLRPIQPLLREVREIPPAGANELAQTAWAWFITHANPDPFGQTVAFMLSVPTWLALTAIALVLIREPVRAPPKKMAT